ncbi:MAG: MFS transporter [Nitriliruptorales bacterium]
MSDAATTEARPPAGALGSNYAKLWTASAISNLGDGIDGAALPLLAAYLTRDPLLFAGVAVAGRLPWLLFSLQAGAIADRVDRKRLMATVNVIRFGLMGALGLAVLGDWATIWLLYLVAFGLGVAETLFDNAAQALMPALVRKAQLERANGRLYGAEIVTNQFAGPPLGGLLFAVAMSLPILLDAGTFLVSGLLIFAISGSYVARGATAPGATAPGPRRRMRQEIGEGLRWLWNHRVLRALALMLGLANMMGMVVFSVFALFALDVVGVSEVGFGLLLTATAVGSFASSLVAGRVADRIGRGPALMWSVVGFSLPMIVQGAFPNVVVVAAMGVVFGFFVVLWNIITVSLRQSIIPDELLGRVNSVYRFFGWGSIPIGGLLGGLLAQAFGLRAPFFVAGAVTLLALVVFLPVVNTRTIEEARAAAAADEGTTGTDGEH